MQIRTRPIDKPSRGSTFPREMKNTSVPTSGQFMSKFASNLISIKESIFKRRRDRGGASSHFTTYPARRTTPRLCCGLPGFETTFIGQTDSSGNLVKDAKGAVVSQTSAGSGKASKLFKEPVQCESCRGKTNHPKAARTARRVGKNLKREPTPPKQRPGFAYRARGACQSRQAQQPTTHPSE